MPTQLFTTLKTDAGYRVTATAAGSYTLFWSLSPDGFTPDALLGNFSDELAVADPARGKRCYFHILDADGKHWVTATRILDFASVENFRELGGYPAADGAFVRWGKFYRAARLTHLTEQESHRFVHLGVRTILDLRSSGEIANHPDPIFAKTEHKAISAIVQMDGNEKDFDPSHLLTQTVEEMRIDAQEFMDIYREMPFGNKAYVWMFERLLAGKTPLLFHCTAGKDRTGIAAALILLALGVPRSVIEEDYVLTNICCKSNIDALIAQYYREGQPVFVREYLSCIGGVGVQNLDAALDEIDKRYTSVDAFLLAEYSLDEMKLAQLRTLYTEFPHP